MSDFNARYAAARKAAIARDFARMNPEQRRGVLTTEGALLLLAGAGSGKTTVLINRVANLLTYGRGATVRRCRSGRRRMTLRFLKIIPSSRRRRSAAGCSAFAGSIPPRRGRCWR